jgi:hypothetical protein
MIQTTDQLFNYYKEYVALTEGHYDYLIDKEDFKKALKEFATLHVEKALEQAFLNSEMRVSENDTNETPGFTNNYDDGYVTITVSKDSILNAYNIEENVSMSFHLKDNIYKIQYKENLIEFNDYIKTYDYICKLFRSKKLKYIIE